MTARQSAAFAPLADYVSLPAEDRVRIQAIASAASELDRARGSICTSETERKARMALQRLRTDADALAKSWGLS